MYNRCSGPADGGDEGVEVKLARAVVEGLHERVLVRAVDVKLEHLQHEQPAVVDGQPSFVGLAPEEHHVLSPSIHEPPP